MDDYIESLNEYCDEWCERCPLTARCWWFTERKPQLDALRSHIDLEGQALVEHIRQSLSHAQELIEDAMLEEGLDPEPRITEEVAREFDESMRRIDEHPLLLGSLEYAKVTHAWLESEIRQADTTDLSVADTGPAQSGTDLQLALEIVERYQVLIVTKLTRAISQSYKTDSPLAVEDARGSAKVVLLAMDQSSSAWMVLRHEFPHSADRILGFLTRLHGLRKLTTDNFPEARAFTRPGFDL